MGYLPVVDLVIADRGWIMEHIANQLADRLRGMTCQIVSRPTNRADLTYFLPYSGQTSVARGSVVSFFTHQEMVEPARSNFIEYASRADYCVCMAPRYEQVLRDAGIERVTTIVPGVDHFQFNPKLRVGVVGRTYHTGRKGEALVARLNGLPWIDLLVTGQGWPARARQLPQSELADFYRGLDCLLIPSSIEGGPMPLLEALACGCPVVAPDIGFVDQFPHISYEADNEASLVAALERLLAEKQERTTAVDGITWEAYAQQHQRLFESLLASSSPSGDPGESIALFQHGSESSTRGGPSTRMRLLAQELAEAGTSVEVISLEDYQAGSAAGRTGVQSTVHVFNSWPMHSATQSLQAVVQTGDVSVFSPIALDLRYLPVYDREMCEALAAYEESPEAFDGIRLRTPRVNLSDLSVPMREGVAGHFASLRHNCQLASKIVALSEFERNFLQRLGVDSGKIHIVRNGIDTGFIRSQGPDRFRREMNLMGPFVLCVGRIEARKNQAGLAIALRDLDVPLVFVGHTGHSDYADLVRKVAGPNVRFIDRIDDRALLASAYHAATVTVLPSWAEGAPLVALEAGAAGCPLLLSEMSGECEYFGDYAEYIHPLDFRGIRSAVLKLLDEPESVEQRLARADFVCERYSIEEHSRRSLEVYRSQSAIREDRGRTYVDITHLAHAISAGRDTTGMPKLEKALFEEFKHENVHFLVWNSSLAQHVVLPTRDLGRMDAYATAREPAIEVAALIEGWRTLPVESLSSSISRKRAAITLFKKTLMKLPRPLRQLAVVALKGVRPMFTPEIEHEHQLPVKMLLGILAARSSKNSTTKKEVPKQDPELMAMPPSLLPCSRLIICGQPWISNDRYIESTASLVKANACRLSMLVPDIVYVSHVDSFPAAEKKAFSARLGLMLELAHDVIVPSKATERDLLDYRGLLKLNFGIRKVALGTPAICKDQTRVHGVKPGCFVIYVASINRRKNHDFLTAAWRIVQNDPSVARLGIRMLYVGQGDVSCLSFEPEDKALITCTGSVSEEQLAWLYENCLFSVYPSLIEGWGFPVQESLSAGKVCLASSGIPAAEEYQGGGVITLHGSDLFGWVGVLKSLLLNDALRNSIESTIESQPSDQWRQAALNILHEEN